MSTAVEQKLNKQYQFNLIGKLAELPIFKAHKDKLELGFSIACGVSLGLGFTIDRIDLADEGVHHIFYLLAYFFGSSFFLEDIFISLRKGKFEIDFLMLVAAIGAAFLDKWSEGALLLFLFSLGHSLEHFAMKRANRSIAALAALSPKMALVKRNAELLEVSVEQLKPGDVVVIKPNSVISADGLVIKGESTVNQASITGESMPVDKFARQSTANIDHQPGEHQRVYSGTMNGNGYLEIEVTRQAKDSTLSKLIRLVNEAREKQSNTQNFTRKFESVFVPSILVFVGLLNFAFLVIDETFAASFYRAITVLVVASPCALVISTPSAVLSGIARGARNGVLFKGGKTIDNLAKVKAIAFDKTGTLTRGEPRITDIIPIGVLESKDLLQIVVSVEQMSDHPLAKAMVKDGLRKLGTAQLPASDSFQSFTGKGVTAKIEGKEVRIGNCEFFGTSISSSICEQLKNLEQQGKTTVLVKMGDDFIGMVAVMDTPREENMKVVQSLKKIGITRITMLSGDNQRVADSVARQIGINDALGNLMPEDKVDAIRQLKKEMKAVAMVGDGVNDAPAMAESTVGIAMGAAGSDVALETADIALMGDKLHVLPFAIGLSRKTREIIRQNIFLSLSVILIMIPVTLFGLASIGPAVLIHEGSTVLVVLNALRLLNYQLETD